MHIYRGKISWSDKLRDEGITILFPTTMTPGDQVYIFYQWSTIPDGLDNKKFFKEGVIVPSESTSETITLSFTLSAGPINFCATRLNNNKLLRLGASVIENSDLATLSLVYESDMHHNPRVYTGNLDCEVSANGKAHKAIEEFLLVVTAQDALGVERLLCVFWQWTEADALRKVNADFTLFPLNNTASQLVDGDFTLMLKNGQEEQERQLLIDKVNTSGETQTLEVVLTTFASTIRVINDLPSTFVQCLVQSNVSTTTSDILGWLGMALAVAGVPLAIALPPAGGLAFALAGLAAATASIGYAPEGKVARYPAMPPAGVLSHPHSAASFSIFAQRIVQDGTSLVVQSATANNVSGDYNLSNISDWKPIMRLNSVVSTGSLASRAFLKLEGLSVGRDIPSSSIGDGNNNINFGIYTYQGQNAIYHRTVPSDDQAEITVFQKSSSSFVSILYSSRSLGTIAIHPLINDQSGLALRLNSYIITGTTANDVQEYDLVGGVNDESIVDFITKDAEPRQAYYTSSDNKFWAVKASANSWAVQYRYPIVPMKVFLRSNIPGVINTTIENGSRSFCKEY